MTYKNKSIASVFALASILLLMPLTNSNVYAEETSALIVGSCGYTVPASVAFTDITPGVTSTLTASFTDWAPVADKNGVSRILVEGSDWKGLGDRSKATLTITTIAENEEVVVNTETYVAKDTPVGANEFQSTTGATAIEVAESLSGKIRAADTLVRVSTGGTNVVTIQAETRGDDLTPKQNDYVFTSDGTSVVLDPADGSFGGGAANVQTHLVAENTHYDMTTDASAAETSYASMSAFKTAAASAVLPQEMIGGTDVSNDLKVNLAIDVSGANLINLPYDGKITQTLTFTITCDGNI